MSALGDLKWNGEPIEFTIGTQGRNWGMNFGLRNADWKSAGGPSAFRDPKFLLPFRDPHSAIRNSLPIYFCQDFGESRCPNLPGVAA
jgi:hypothetical protein